MTTRYKIKSICPRCKVQGYPRGEILSDRIVIVCECGLKFDTWGNQNAHMVIDDYIISFHDNQTIITDIHYAEELFTLPRIEYDITLERIERLLLLK